jgi:tetratricopeptide (TPR) repeat protein
LGSRTFTNETKKALEQSAFHFRKSGNRVMLAEVNDQFGYVYNATGDFEKYFESIKQGLREKKRIGDNRGMIWSYYRLAYIYQSVGDFETALDYFRQSFRQADSQSVPWHPYRSMGDIFMYLKNYDSSLYYFQKVFERSRTHGPAWAGLGKLYVLLKQYDKALDYLQNAMIIFKKTNNDGGMMWALVDVGKSYTGLKQLFEKIPQILRCL